jgi:hypothetical protein
VDGILSGLGLAAPAGLNAWLTLLMVALADRFTGLVDLPADYEWLSSWPAIGALSGLLAVEEIVDKIPASITSTTWCRRRSGRPPAPS